MKVHLPGSDIWVPGMGPCICSECLWTRAEKMKWKFGGTHETIVRWINPDAKKFCRDCGEKLETMTYVDHYDEYTGEPVSVTERGCPECEGDFDDD